jgi:dipeptidyl aminopeptidase/acylaminoacyl peptidase
MRRILIQAALSACAFLSAAPVLAQQPAKRALTLEDYYRVKSVGAADISPDGRWVSYTVGLPVEETNRNVVETWLVRAEGAGAPVRLLHNGATVQSASWTDDNRLRFASGGATWLLDPSRINEPATSTQATPAAAGGAVSPDGRWRARARPMPVPAKPTPVLSEFEKRHEERFRGDAFDWYPFRQDGQRFPLPDRRNPAPVEIVVEPASGTGAVRQLTQLGKQIGGVQWIPDGTAIQFTVNEGAGDETSYGDTDLYRVSLDGTITRLTNDGYSYSNVTFSPDGRWMSYVKSMGTDMIIAQKLDHGGSRDLYIMPAAGGAPINLTEQWNLDPGTPRWSPDSRHIYFTAETGGAVHLFRVASSGGAVQQITTGARRINGVDFDRAFRRMVYTVGDIDVPPDIYVADLDGRNERRLTDVHRDMLNEIDLNSRPAETIHWNSTDGTRIEGFLIYPHNYDPRSRYPLIVMNHGGPHSASGYGFSFKNKLFAAHGYFVFLPNFRSSTGYGDAFKWGTWGGWGIKDGEDVVSGIDHLVANYPIDRTRVGSTGHSYGGIITNWLITRYPDRFRAAIPGAGESNWTSNFALSDIARTKETEFFGPPWDPRARAIMIAQSPYLNCGSTQAATLFIHGQVDYRVPLEGAIQLYTCLKKIGVPTKMIIYEGQSHGISGHWNNVHRMMHELQWWETYLKPVATPKTDSR